MNGHEFARIGKDGTFGTEWSFINRVHLWFKKTVLSELHLRGFRCFEKARLELGPGATCIVGPNARGKTSLLEAACVLLRLQSPRASSLAQAVGFGGESFLVEGKWAGSHGRYLYSKGKRQLFLDAVEQKRANEYLALARVVWFGNDDLDLIRGGSEGRRRFLDFAIAQIRPAHRARLRAYEKALRSRNALLKNGGARREIAAFDEGLIASGEAVRAARRVFIEELTPHARRFNEEIGGPGPVLEIDYRDGSGEGELALRLAQAQAEEERLRQTVVGPHRDDLQISFAGYAAVNFASEGQQRTAALALRLGEAELVGRDQDGPPLFLIDDIFGELDVDRRNRLLGLLPSGGQQLITTTHLEWAHPFASQILEIEKLRKL